MDYAGLGATKEHAKNISIAKALASSTFGSLSPTQMQLARALERGGYLTIHLPTLADGFVSHDSKRLKFVGTYLPNPPIPNESVLKEIRDAYNHWFRPDKPAHPPAKQVELFD